MNPIDFRQVEEFVNENIVAFHDRRISMIRSIRLDLLTKKNPYLFRAKNVLSASEIVVGLLDAFLSSSEEKMFGDFLEMLAIFVAEKTCGGHKSSSQGIDLEFIHNGTHYLVSIKSGTSWGNSSQQAKLEEDLKKAAARVKQSIRSANVEPVLGICYGKTKTSRPRGYLKVVGQNFWYLISENKDLYASIIEPIGYRAKEQNETFLEERGYAVNRLSRQFTNLFCLESGEIDWPRLVRHNSGNYDLDKFLPSVEKQSDGVAAGILGENGIGCEG